MYFSKNISDNNSMEYNLGLTLIIRPLPYPCLKNIFFRPIILLLIATLLMDYSEQAIKINRNALGNFK